MVVKIGFVFPFLQGEGNAMGVSGSDIFVLQFDRPVISNFVPGQM